MASDEFNYDVVGRGAWDALPFTWLENVVSLLPRIAQGRRSEKMIAATTTAIGLAELDVQPIKAARFLFWRHSR